MSSDVAEFDNYAYETVAGQCAIVAALVIALHENGIMPLGRYSDALQRLWLEMPEEEAVGEAGAVVERVLDLLAARSSAADRSNDAEQALEHAAFVVRPNNGNAVPRAAPTTLKALLHALRGAGQRARRRDRKDRFSISEADVS